MRKLMIGVAAAALTTLGIATPAQAQGWPTTPGDYWDVSAIDVADGSGLAYMTFLANRWRSNQEFAKSQGWIKAYYVLSNEYARKDEPDLYLITVFEKFADAAEGERRRIAFEAHNQRTTAQLQAESGDRVKIRTLAGDMLLREMKFK
ncbi:MAG: hypothetical protein ACLGHC_02045 [Alphaproteobacteria bacterium]